MGERIFGGKGSYEKYSLVERRDLVLKVKEFKTVVFVGAGSHFFTPLPPLSQPPLLSIFGKVSNPPIVRHSRVVRTQNFPKN